MPNLCSHQCTEIDGGTGQLRRVKHFITFIHVVINAMLQRQCRHKEIEPMFAGSNIGGMSDCPLLLCQTKNTLNWLISSCVFGSLWLGCHHPKSIAPHAVWSLLSPECPTLGCSFSEQCPAGGGGARNDRVQANEAERLPRSSRTPARNKFNRDPRLARWHEHA